MLLNLLSVVTSVILNLCLGIIVITRAPRSVARNVFVISLLSIPTVPVGLFLCRYVYTDLVAIGVIGCGLLAASMLHFILIFPNHVEEPLRRKHLLLYLLAILALPVRYENVHFHEYGATRDVNGWFYPLVVCTLVYVVTTVIVTTYKYVTSSGIQKKQLQYILLGYALGIGMVSITNLVLPGFFNNSRFSVLGPLFFTAIPFMSTIAILKYSFMDISLVLKKGLVLSILISLTSLLFVAGFSSFLGTSPSVTVLKVLVISAVISFGMPGIKAFLEDITDRIFFRKKVNYPRSIAKISHRITSYFEEQELITFITVSLCETFKLESCCLFLNTDPVKLISFHKDKKILEYTDLPDLAIRDYLENNRTYLLHYRLTDSVAPGPLRNNIEQEFDRHRLAVAFPIIVNNTLYAVLGIGQKLSGDISYQEEIEHFIPLTNQLSLAFEKLRYYQEKLDMEKQLAETEKRASIGELTRRLVHEIKNPLTSISAFFQFSVSDLGEEELQHLKKQASQSIQRILTLIADLSRYSKISATGFALQSINSIIQEELILIKPQCMQRNVTVTFTPGQVPATMIDADTMKQALLNIFQNAIEAMPEGGHISISTTVGGQEIVVRISDKGIGIPQHMLHEVFNPLMTTKQYGTGLGLSITQSIIKEHRGSIHISSQAGQGTTVTILLPITTSPPGPARHATANLLPV